MLHALPFNTFGEVAALGLEVQVYCPSCYTTRQKSIPRPNGSTVLRGQMLPPLPAPAKRN
jgi:hypothetical protein